MASTSFIQDSFHGGEWLKNFQGRSTDKGYKTAMNVCFNGLPIEEGAWVRRPGTRLAAPTYKGLPGKLLPIAMETTASYDIEFTDGQIRFFNGGIPCFTEEVTMVSSISMAKPAVLLTQTAVQWKDADEITLIFDNNTVDKSSSLVLRNRILKITPVAMSISAWSNTVTYVKFAIVSFSGENYQSLVTNNVGNQPDTNPIDWELLAGTPSNTFALYDSITGVPVDGSTLNFSGGNIVVLRLMRIASPWTAGAWATNRLVQDEDTSFVLNAAVQPQKLTISPNSGDALFIEANVQPSYFEDGPYLDPLPDSQLTVSAQSGVITITAAFRVYSAGTTYNAGRYVTYSGASYRSLVDANIGNTPSSSPTKWKLVPLGTAVTGEDVPVVGFQQKDVGRHVRLFSSPPQWDAATGFTFGSNCFYNHQAYQNVSGATLTGVQPDTNPDKWTINPSGSAWAWGKITSVAGPTVANVQIIPMPETVVGDPGYQIMYDATNTVNLWRVGAYSDAVGWPANGCLHEGRLWLGGVVKNRFDASTISEDGKLTGFSPTLPDGTVTDASAISYRLRATDKNQIFWFSPEKEGIIVGTLGGEWLIQASNAGDTLTPTSIQAKRVTKYGCANIEPRRTGIALVFVHKFVRKVFEFISDIWTSKYIAPNLNKKAKHITTTGLKELAYQEELAPVLWGRLGDGSFVGTTYRRENSAVADDPTMNGWHRHQLATGRTCDGIISGPSATGLLDTVSMLTADPSIIGTSGGLNQQVHWVEVMTDIFDEKDSLYDAWFLDGGMVPSSMYEATVNSQLGVYFTGLFYQIGQTVTVFGGGLDLGDYVVDSSGRVFVPYGTGVAPALIDYTQPGAGHYLFTAAYVAAVEAKNFVPRNGGIFTSTSGPTVSLGNPTSVPTTSQIQSFVPTNTFSGETLPVAQGPLGGAAIAFGYDLVTFQSQNGSLGLRTFRMSTGAQLANNTFATLGYTAPVKAVFASVTDPGVGTPYVWIVAGNSIYNPVIQVDQGSLALTTAFNRTSFVSGGTVSGARSANSLNGVAGQGYTFLLDCAFLGLSVELIDPSGSILATDPVNGGGLVSEGNVDEGNNNFGSIIQSNTQVGAHIVSSGNGTVAVFGYYGVIHTVQNSVQGSYLGHKMDLNSKKGKGKKKISISSVDLFTPSISGASYHNVKKIGTIIPSQVRPEWSHFTQVGGVCQDQTDNGTIVAVENSVDRLAQTWTQTASGGFFNGGTTYAIDDIVHYATTGSNTNFYISLSNGNVGNTPTNNPTDAFWRYFSSNTAPTWLIGTTYAQYDIVQGSDSKFYRSNNAGNIGHDPTTTTGFWTFLTQGYKLGEKVISGAGEVYEAKVDGVFDINPIHNGHPSSWTFSQLQRSYILKLAPLTATIEWQVPVNSVANTAGNMMGQSVVDGGVYIHMSPVTDGSLPGGVSGYPCYIIDTTTGAYKVVVVPGITVPGYYASFGSQYQVLVNLNTYDSTKTNAPVPLNSTVSFNTVPVQCLLTIGTNAPDSLIPSSGDFPKPRPIIKIEGGTTGQFPCVVGTNFVSQGQILRLIDQQELKAQTGPGTANIRRTHYAQALLTNSIGVQFGTDFTKMEMAIIKDDFQKQMTPTNMYTGVIRHTLKDGYSYDSMLAWTVTRPYPLTIANVGGKAKSTET